MYCCLCFFRRNYFIFKSHSEAKTPDMQRFEELCDSIRKGILECSICQETLRQPRSLLCQHTFCESCLRQHLSASDSRRILTCPLCRTKTPVSKRGVESLPVNFFISELQTSLEALRSESATSNRGNFSCASCKASSSAHTFVCLACYQHFEETFPPPIRKFLSAIQYFRLKFNIKGWKRT